MTALLDVVEVSAGYGRSRALFDVSLQIAEGAGVAVLGPNGAGKTTLARVCSGLLAPTDGKVSFAGIEVTDGAVHRLARAGLAHLPEGRAVFASLSVEQNLVLPLRQFLGRRGVGPALDRAYGAFPRLGQRRAQPAGTLSGGEQRLLSLARVLAHPPRLLIADELSLGLDPGVGDQVWSALGTVAAAGTALMVADQQADRALTLAGWGVVLAHGRVAAQGPASELASTIGPSLGGRPLSSEPPPS